MKRSFVTEEDIRKEAFAALFAKRAEQQAHKDDKAPVDLALIERELAMPEYQSWIQDRIDDARRAGRLLTPQQAMDVRVGRWLREGDRARYLGPNRMERSNASGNHILRPTGQTGTITNVVKDAFGGLRQFTFMPDIDAKTRAASDAGMLIEVLTCTTNNWVEFERIAE